MRARLLIAVLALSLIFAALARAEVTQSHHLRLSISGELTPKALRTLRIEINRGGRLEERGLPTCPLSEIAVATSERASAACRGALVGSGSFHANIVLRGQAPYPTGKLLLFNGRAHGKAVLLGHIYASHPFATSFVITFKIAQRAHGSFGTVLSASLPEALGNWGYVTGIEMRLSQRYSYGGKRRSYLSAGCPAPKGFGKVEFPLIKASFVFDGGRKLNSTLNRTCRAKGA